MPYIQDLCIYPIKSLGGYRVEEALVTARGLAQDRRWMLVDQQHRFLTQREHPVMALLQVAPVTNGFRVFHRNRPEDVLQIPTAADGEAIEVDIWGDECQAVGLSAEANDWFTAQLGIPCQLVYMPDSSLRQVDRTYAPEGSITGFTDGYPILVISQASLDDLNSRLPEPVPMNRFRPNIVPSGGEAFVEDRMGRFTINGIRFDGVKPCARCVMTTIDQATGEPGKEPLKTLAAYRSRNNKVLFGQNVIARGTGLVRVGDGITVDQWLDPLFS